MIETLILIGVGAFVAGAALGWWLAQRAERARQREERERWRNANNSWNSGDPSTGDYLEGMFFGAPNMI